MVTGHGNAMADCVALRQTSQKALLFMANRSVKGS